MAARTPKKKRTPKPDISGETSLPVEQILDMAAPYNPRKKMPTHEFAALRRALRELGVGSPITLNRRTRAKGWRSGSKPVIVGGHQRAKAASSEGLKEFPVFWVDLDREEEISMNVGLNRIQGSFDDQDLVDLLAKQRDRGADTTITGVTDDELARKMRKVQETEPPDSGGMSPESFGFATSLPRASAPLRHWRSMKLLEGRVLDFGSGKEEHRFDRFDPFTRPDYELLTLNWDVVMVNYVLNVQPSDHLVQEIAALTSVLAPVVCFAVVCDAALSGTAACGGRRSKDAAEWRTLLGPMFEIEDAKASFVGFIGKSRSMRWLS